MCVTPKEFTERLGDFGEYCPVSLADYGHLVDCSDNPTLEFAAEFRGRYYKMETSKELEMFLENPTAYVPPLAPRALPPPDMLPKRRTATEMKEKFPCQIELQGYCPVTYLDGKKRYCAASDSMYTARNAQVCNRLVAVPGCYRDAFASLAPLKFTTRIKSVSILCV